MIDENITKFVVLDGERPVGIVTETDVAKAMRSFREIVEDKYQDHRIRNLLVKDIMSTPLITVDRGMRVREIVDLMLKKGISSVPVTENGSILGIVTRSSLIRAL